MTKEFNTVVCVCVYTCACVCVRACVRVCCLRLTVTVLAGSYARCRYLGFGMLSEFMLPSVGSGKNCLELPTSITSAFSSLMAKKLKR